MMGIKHDSPTDEKKEVEPLGARMNRQGHVKAGKNEPEPVKRTDLAHSIAHATGVSHDCNVKDPKDTKLSKSPEPK